MKSLDQLDQLCAVLDTPESYRKEFAVGVVCRFPDQLPKIAKAIRRELKKSQDPKS